jgi:hypothetical protein
MEPPSTALASLSLRADAQLSSAQAGVPTPAPSFFEIDWPCLEIVRGGVGAEQAMAAVVCRPGETGRGRDLGAARLAEIDVACAQHGMNRYQALSLRRQLMRASSLGRRDLGGQGGQATSARLFEIAVETFLCTSGVPFLTPSQQKAQRGQNSRLPVTPDILFIHPTKINGREVRWLDSKLFYGNVLLLHKKSTAMCKVLKTAERYVRLMGPGALVFGQSFNGDLPAAFADLCEQVVLLDATPVDTSELDASQKANGGLTKVAAIADGSAHNPAGSGAVSERQVDTSACCDAPMALQPTPAALVRPVAPTSVLELCKFWRKHRCFRQSSCKFAHSKDELGAWRGSVLEALAHSTERIDQGQPSPGVATWPSSM